MVSTSKTHWLRQGQVGALSVVVARVGGRPRVWGRRTAIGGKRGQDGPPPAVKMGQDPWTAALSGFYVGGRVPSEMTNSPNVRVAGLARQGVYWGPSVPVIVGAKHSGRCGTGTRDPDSCRNGS
jgi:hypothetical protein